MGMTTCFLCNGSFPSDEMCRACFGPFQFPSGHSDVALQEGFRFASPVPAFNSVPTNVGASPRPSGTRLRHPDTVAGSSECILESSSGSPQMSRYRFRTRTPTENVRADVEDKSDQTKPRTRGAKRKRLDQSKKTGKARAGVQKPTKHAKTPPQISGKEPPLVYKRCAECNLISYGSVTNSGPTKICHHRQCSHCRISYTESGFWGRGSWTCCRCQGGPKPTPPLPQECENVYYPHALLLRCEMCLRTALV